MYPLILTLLSWMRWIVVVVGVLAVARFFVGWLGRKAWTPLDARLLSASPLAMLVIFLAIPWPFVAAGSGRPWLRLG